MMKLISLTFFLTLFCACQQSSKVETTLVTKLKLLQINIWQEGTMVEGGFDAIASEIIHADADIVFFSEIRNYNKKEFIPRLLNALKQRGKYYFGETSTLDAGVISRYKIETQQVVYPLNKDAGSILKAIIRIQDKTIVAYSAHLDYRNYACYLPRGYCGYSWEKLNERVSSVDSVLKANLVSRRDEAINAFVSDAKEEISKGNLIFLGGDFNEPSHLDWQSDTKDLRDHNGLVVDWPCSSILYDNGFIDSYRDIYPDAVSNPGFTFPSDNDKIEVGKLTWAPDADERERIDFIYYYPDTRIKLENSIILGPSRSILKNERVEDDSDDNFILPLSTWPSDHKAVLSVFVFRGTQVP